MNKFPILDFDPSPEAIIQPANVLPAIDIAPACVLCFFRDVIDDLKEAGRLTQIYRLGSEIGPNPVYELSLNGRRLTLCQPGVGAPLAGSFMEELIALGCRHFIACGGCGVLNSNIAVGQLVIPATAVRDEGTSYHYLAPGATATASPAAVAAIESVVSRHELGCIVGKTWTTDAPYRETPAIVAQRQQEGCLVVEMESAAFMAVAQFREVQFGQILYGGDDLSGGAWDHRDWHRQFSTRDKLFWLAAEAALALTSPAAD